MSPARTPSPPEYTGSDWWTPYSAQKNAAGPVRGDGALGVRAGEVGGDARRATSCIRAMKSSSRAMRSSACGGTSCRRRTGF